jgi:hypothetical protein
MRKCVGIVLIAAASALGACGGDDEEPLSRADFVRQADAICADAEKRTDALPEPQSAADLKKTIDQARPIVEEEVDKLKDLGDRAPDDVKEDFDRALVLLDDQLEVLDEFQAAGTDQAKLQAASEKGDKLSKEADGIARRIGLKECGAD